MILECIKENNKLQISYKSYHEKHPSTFNISPFGVKLFKQRWYVIAESEIKELRIYALDRIKSTKITNAKFAIPNDFDIDTYFSQCYGIINDRKIEPTIVKLKVSSYQSNYFIDLPLHHSQKEIEQTEKYTIFEYYLKPTYDFIQEIIKHTYNIEVISPQSLRKEVKSYFKNTLIKYE